ncbi:MAG: tetratricopeptide repeat protein [Thiohalomonadales bacterium]
MIITPKLPILSLCLLLISTLSSPLYASYEKGVAALSKNQFSKAYKLWLPLAQKGNTQVQAAIAVMYHTGTGVKQSYKKAFYWYKKAAESGNTAAQANLGVMYAKGTGTKKDFVKSYAWYNVAADGLPVEKIGSALWGIDYLATQMSTQQIDKAKKLSKKYLKKYVPKKK